MLYITHSKYSNFSSLPIVEREITSMKSKVLILTVSFLSFGSPLILPGSCPSSNLASDIIRKFTHFRVIGKVSFNSSPNTYLFGGVSGEACDLIVNATYLTYDKKAETALRGVFEPVQGSLTKLDDNTYLFEPPTSCKYCNPLIDRFRIWKTKFGAFVWSCAEISSENTHDEGLMVLMDKDEYISGWFTSNLAEILSEMKSNIGIYFNKTLVDAVTWEDVGEKTFCNYRTLHPALIPFYWKNRTPPVTALATFITIILLVACYIFKLSRFKWKNSGQVVPIQ